MLENIHDLPWLGANSIGPETVASMAVIGQKVRQQYTHWPIGLQMLSGANNQALAVAHVAGNIGNHQLFLLSMFTEIHNLFLYLV